MKLLKKARHSNNDPLAFSDQLRLTLSALSVQPALSV
jgi:hypothetical protein